MWSGRGVAGAAVVTLATPVLFVPVFESTAVAFVPGFVSAVVALSAALVVLTSLIEAPLVALDATFVELVSAVVFAA